MLFLINITRYMCLWMAVWFVVSFNSPEEGNICFQNVVWCYVVTVEEVEINISNDIYINLYVIQEQLCFICHRLLLLLPPSSPYMDRLAQPQDITYPPMLLHSLVWGPRSACKTFTGWMKVGLCLCWYCCILSSGQEDETSLGSEVNLSRSYYSSLKMGTDPVPET